MLGSQGLLGDGQGALIQRQGFFITSLGAIQLRQVVEADAHIWMLESEGFFIDGQRPLVLQRQGFFIAPLDAVQLRQVVEADARIWMLGFQGFFMMASARSNSFN